MISSSYLMLIVATLVIGMGAQWYVNHKLKTYSHVANSTGLTGAEAKLLSLSPGEPAINLRRITWAGNTLVEYCNSIVRGDFFTYTVELK